MVSFIQYAKSFPDIQVKLVFNFREILNVLREVVHLLAFRAQIFELLATVNVQNAYALVIKKLGLKYILPDVLPLPNIDIVIYDQSVVYGQLRPVELLDEVDVVDSPEDFGELDFAVRLDDVLQLAHVLHAAHAVNVEVAERLRPVEKLLQFRSERGEVLQLVVAVVEVLEVNPRKILVRFYVRRDLLFEAEHTRVV